MPVVQGVFGHTFAILLHLSFINPVNYFSPGLPLAMLNNTCELETAKAKGDICRQLLSC